MLTIAVGNNFVEEIKIVILFLKIFNIYFRLYPTSVKEQLCELNKFTEAICGPKAKITARLDRKE